MKDIFFFRKNQWKNSNSKCRAISNLSKKEYQALISAKLANSMTTLPTFSLELEENSG